MNLPWSHVPFAYRAGALLVLLAVVALADWWWRRGTATRWKEYTFLFLAGLLGALAGAANDALTATLSPDYFVLGKGMAAGAGLRRRAMELGAEAGFGAAIFAAACFLLANNPEPGRPVLRYGRLLAFALRPILGALGGALVLGTYAFSAVHTTLHPALQEVITAGEALWFSRVWLIHLGLYLGLAGGLIWGVVGIRRARKARQP